MLGSNLEATRYSGVDTRRVLIGIYTVQRAVLRRRLPDAGPVQLGQRRLRQSYLLVTILAAVMGGVDPFGGFGRISGLMLALVVLVISSGCNLLGMSQHLTLAIWGLTLIAVMGVKFLIAPGSRSIWPAGPIPLTIWRNEHEQAGCPRAGLGRRLERGGLHQGRSQLGRARLRLHRDPAAQSVRLSVAFTRAA